MSDATKKFCLSFNIHYLLKLPDSELGRCLVDRSTGRDLPAADVRAHLRELLMHGYIVAPVCDHYDSKGFCSGHPVCDAITS